MIELNIETDGNYVLSYYSPHITTKWYGYEYNIYFHMEEVVYYKLKNYSLC